MCLRHWRVSKLVLAVLGVASLLTGSGPRLAAQAPATGQSQTQPPVFRSSVRLIDVDVYVTDQQGRPVKGLTRDDFELLEDGKPQEIRAFTPIDLAVDVPGASGSSPTTESRLPPADVATNVDVARTYILLLDSPYMVVENEYMTGLAYTAAVKRVAAQFVNEALGPRDQAAVIHVQGTTSNAQGLTSNHQLLLDSIAKYGQGRSGAESAPERGDPEIAQRILATYRALQDVSERLAIIGGRRKTIVWIGGQLPFDLSNAYDCGGTPPSSVVERLAGVISIAQKDAMRTATRNNVAIFPVDPMGMTTDTAKPLDLTNACEPNRRAPESVRQASLREVAEDTGGSAVVGTNNFSGGYSRIVQENSTYYMLGYSPAEDYQDGTFHPIQVRVKNRPLLVHARKGYTAPDGNVKPANLPPLPDGVSTATRDALRSPASVSGLQVDLVSAAFKGTASDGSVVLDAQLRGPGLGLDGGERVTVSYQVIDTDGTIVTGAYKTFTLNLREQSRKQVIAEGLRFVDRVNLKPGRYEVRFVADQPASDTLGSVVTHVEVPTFDDPLSISGVLVGSLSTWEHHTLFRDDDLKKRLSVDPTAIRRFPQGDELSVYAELYQRAAAKDDLEVTVSVLGADGKARVKEDAMPLEGNTPQHGAFRAHLSLADLSPGVYVLSVEGTSAKEGVEPVRRQLPFTVVED